MTSAQDAVSSQRLLGDASSMDVDSNLPNAVLGEASIILVLGPFQLCNSLVFGLTGALARYKYPDLASGCSARPVGLSVSISAAASCVLDPQHGH